MEPPLPPPRTSPIILVCIATVTPSICDLQGYRNKCEFTLSLGEDGLATAGFRAARFQEGVPITVESPKDCPQVTNPDGDAEGGCAFGFYFVYRLEFCSQQPQHRFVDERLQPG